MAAVKISSARRQAAQKFRAPQQCSFSNINRAAGPYGVRLSSCAGIRETADMDATVPLHDNRPARLRAVRGSGSNKRSTGVNHAGDQSQNLGHGDKARARRFYRVSVCAELALIAVLATVCFLLPERIVGIFSHNPQVIAAGLWTGATACRCCCTITRATASWKTA